MTGPAGDVAAARSQARALLAAASNTLPDLLDPVLATLVLTAVCLDAGVATGGEPKRTDLAAHLTRMLEVGMPGPALLRSPMQFVRYAALELQALPARRRVCLLQVLLRVICPPSPGKSSVLKEHDEKSRDVRKL